MDDAAVVGLAGEIEPQPGARVRGDTLTIDGRVSSPVGVDAVTVNGAAADVARPGASETPFDHEIALPDGNGKLEMEIAATGGLGNTDQLELSVHYDTRAPALSVDGSLAPAPEVSSVQAHPYRLRGIVTDADLGGVSVAGETVGVEPTGDGDRYRFDAGVELPVDEPRTVTVAAWDRAGHRVERRFRLERSSDVELEIVSPGPGAEVNASDGTGEVDVTVRGTGLDAGDTLHAAIDDGEARRLERAGRTGNATLTAALDGGSHRLVATARDDAGEVIGRRSTAFEVVEPSEVALSLAERSPARRATGVEPDTAIELTFNRAIEAGKLDVTVRETIHGTTYADGGSGAGISGGGAVAMRERHRDREAVAVGASVFPGERVASYALERALTYGADIDVAVRYDGERLARWRFGVREPPTLVQGSVATQFATPAADVVVALPGLDRRTRTNSDGVFTFGFGEPAERDLPAGRHRLVINPGQVVAELATLERWIAIEGQRLNSVAAVTLPALNTDTPYRPIASGEREVRLAEGDLKLDLSSAQLAFPDDRRAGAVHAQFLEAAALPYPRPSARPAWLYALHPAGITVAGEVGVSIAMPERQGGRAYAPPDGDKAVLVGLDDEALALRPVGVGRVDDGRIVAAQPIELDRLDYLGYARVPHDQQSLLTDYLDGERSLDDLRSALARAGAGS